MKNLKKLSRVEQTKIQGGFTQVQIDACGGEAYVCFRAGGWVVGENPEELVMHLWFNKEKSTVFTVLFIYFILFERSSIASIGFNALKRSSSSIRISGSSYFIHKYNFSIVLRFI